LLTSITFLYLNRPQHAQTLLYLLFFSLSGTHPDLHSFPTLRSSDLASLLPPWALVSSYPSSGTYMLPRTFRAAHGHGRWVTHTRDRKSTRLNSSHLGISYAVFCLKKKTELLETNVHKTVPTPTSIVE